MGASIHIGRVGCLAVALGVGAAVLTGHGLASADTETDSTSGASSSLSGSPSTTDSDPSSSNTISHGSDGGPTGADGEADEESAPSSPSDSEVNSDVDPLASAEADSEQVSVSDTAAPLVDAEDTDLADEGSPVPAGDDSTVPVESTAALALVGSTRREPSETTGAGPSGEPGVVTAAAQSAGITVNSVDVAFGDGVVNGAIDAVSSRGLPLNHRIASAPDRGGELRLEVAGAFTLVPDDAAVTAGETERFSVVIAEKTDLETFLEKIPLLGAFVPQFFATLRATPIVRDFLAPFIGSAVVRQISVDLSGLTGPSDDEPTPVPLPVDAAAGWNLYTWQARSDAVVNAIERQDPGLVRWIVEMDRLLEDETTLLRTPRSWSWDTDTTFDGFFEALADNDTTLVVALWNKDTWAKSMRACDICGWPKLTEFAAFVQDLETEAEKFGVNVIFEAQNEPDLRWGSLNAATNIGATENFTTQWHVGWPAGYAQYRGGTGSLWQQMHDVVDSPFASGGIISRYTAEITLAERISGNYSKTNTSTRWIDATAPLVDYTSFHRYGLANTTVDQYVDWVYNEWSIWRDRKGFAVPFYIGEIGPSSTGSVEFTDADAATMRDIHAALDQDPRFENTYLGMTAHVANLSETSRGWWDPAFSLSDVVG